MQSNILSPAHFPLFKNHPIGTASYSRMGALWDLILAPLFIVCLVFYPYFAIGKIDYLEDGQYLAVIDSLFRGKAMYREVSVFFGPGSYLLPAAFLKLFQDSAYTLRLYFLTGHIAMYLGLYALCLRVSANRFLTSLLLLLAIADSNYPFWSVHWGGYRFAFGLWMMFFLAQHKASSKHVFLAIAGFLAAFSSLMSYDMALVSVIASGVYLIANRSKSRVASSTKLWTDAGVFYGGFFIILSIFFAWLASTDSLAAFFQDAIDLPKRGVWAHRAPQDFRGVWEMYVPGVFLSGVFILHFIANRKQDSAQHEFQLFSSHPIFLSLWGYAFVMYLMSFRAITGPQFENGLLLAWVLIAILLVHVRACRLNSRRPFVLFVVSLCLSCCFIISQIPWRGAADTREQHTVSWWTYQLSKTKYLAHYHKLFPAVMAPIKKAPEGIHRLSGLYLYDFQYDEIVFLFNELGRAGALNAGVKLISFPDLSYFNYIYQMDFPGRFAVSGHIFADSNWQKEYLEAIDRLRPEFCLLRTDLSILAISVGRQEEICPEVIKKLRSCYQVFGRSSTVDLLGRADL